jgi:hypothetical protein
MMSEKTSSAQVTPKTYRRRARNILIHKPMQREFALVLIGLLMVSTLAVGYVIHATVREATGGAAAYHFGKISPYEVLSDISYQLVVRVSAILFLTLVVVGFYGVFFLHRVAGPVYRFRQVFLRLNDGETPNEIKLREGDFFSETAMEINRLLKRLKFEKSRTKTVKEKLDQIIASNPASGPAKELKSLLDKESID